MLVSLVVLRVRDIEVAAEFYRRLGLSLASEKHETGPRHYSSTLGDVVFEIYPQPEPKPFVPMMIGFRVPDVQATVGWVKEMGGRVIRERESSPRGLMAIVEDFDGNRIELIQD